METVLFAALTLLVLILIAWIVREISTQRTRLQTAEKAEILYTISVKVVQPEIAGAQNHAEPVQSTPSKTLAESPQKEKTPAEAGVETLTEPTKLRYYCGRCRAVIDPATAEALDTGNAMFITYTCPGCGRRTFLPE